MDELRIAIRHKVNDAFQYGEETKGLSDYKTINAALDLVVNQIMALIASYGREARIDEISGVQLEYGHYVAQTFVDGEAMTILDRIAKLKALGVKPEGKPNE